MSKASKTREQVEAVYRDMKIGAWTREHVIAIASALCATNQLGLARDLLQLAGHDLAKLRRELEAERSRRAPVRHDCTGNPVTGGSEPSCATGRSDASGELSRVRRYR